MNTIQLFSHLSNIVTVIAFLFAAYQFFLWRKQQRYSLEIESLLNMEDLFEIYVAALMRVHGYFDKANKLAIEAKDKAVEDRRNLDEYLRGRFRDMISESAREINEQSTSYSLARYRVIRLNFDIDTKNELDPEWLRDKFDEFLQRNNSLEEVAGEISKIKKVAYEEFKILRSSI
ncbi:hypothetical protein [Halomonas sp. Y3]|uniref:hypothetical protein n=1 Tax=Halomonas sp. Y3 TaxID=2956797 RepID=UPI00209EC20C|nr:hypothetical protein [Halomonas sp. Y3]